MKKKAILLLFCAMPISAASAQFAPGDQTVTTCSDGPSFYAEVNTHANSVYKVFGYRANGKLAKQNPDIINAWVGVETNPLILPLKNTGEGYLLKTNDPGIAPQKAEMAFFMPTEWDNNGAYTTNYHPFRTCEQLTVPGSFAGGDISKASWDIVLKGFTQEPFRRETVNGKCVDNTGGHEFTYCSDRLTKSECETPDARCRWQASEFQWPPASTDH